MSEAANESIQVTGQNKAQQAAPSGILARLQERRRLSQLRAEARRRFVVENQTARALKINPVDTAGAKDALLLTPFGARTLSVKQYQLYETELERWKNLGLVTTNVLKDNSLNRLLYLGALVFGVAIVLALIYNLRPLSPVAVSEPPRALERITNIYYQFGYLAGTFAWGMFFLSVCLLAGYFLRRMGWLQQTGRAVSLILVAASVLFVAAVCPALTVMYFGLEEWMLNEPINWLFPPATFGRLLQVVFVIIAALLPALLYFLFDRQKVTTVRKTFYRQIVMLDPSLYSSQEAEEKYGHLINEVYGDKSVGYYLVNVGLPIALSSVLIAIGWLMILLPITPDPNMSLSSIFKMFEPHVTPISFGFLGAYFFTLNMVFKRYVRSDLTPKAYSQITVRILITTILVWAVSVLPTLAPDANDNYSPVLLVLAFCLGVVPETGVKVLQEFLRKALGRFNDTLLEKDPLTELEGVDLYDRARLSEEGVDNVENLAHHNIVHLLVQTRIPVSRLVDMFDQAILYLHLRDVPADTRQEAVSSTEPTDKTEAGRTAGSPTGREVLRSYGVRTATDLLAAWPTGPQSGTSILEPILRSYKPELADRLRVVVTTLQDDDWMPQLRYWRAQITRKSAAPVSTLQDFLDAEKLDQGEFGSVATSVA